jgi:hypothetical protein
LRCLPENPKENSGMTALNSFPQGKQLRNTIHHHFIYTYNMGIYAKSKTDAWLVNVNKCQLFGRIAE